MFRYIAVVFEMIKVVVVEFLSAFAVLDAFERIENTGFGTL
jgi:hypothetical protein